ncbi:FecCD family ABC transporter permease [Brachybacterium alimentarium]|uniref:FecCD family ABC transporter permease n=1 Tax=Brachybacterium alimentarium TaxID=47845 RepID=UPI002162D74D|nr:iron chelate uptake ABC transporter family permease subunit [Brachybacterium alimentarium]
MHLPLRRALVSLSIILAAAIMLVLSVGTGEVPLPADRVISALLGTGEAGDVLVVRQWRLPRALVALLLGAALGIGGAIFQSLTRNPLGSPDIIGFGTGSYTGALLVILFLGGSSLGTAAGALLGGIATALAVYLLARTRSASSRERLPGFRLIIVGIGVSAMLSALNTWIILRAEVEDAMRVAIWGAGSLNGLSWQHVRLSAAAVLLIALCAMVLAERMHLLEMGDDLAIALGIRTEATRLLLILVGISAVAVVASIAGPISFVALAAPQIARRLTRDSGITLGPAALVGAFLLLGSDYLAQRIHPQTPLPVGVVTVSLGGAYLVWLLLREGRKGRQ